MAVKSLVIIDYQVGNLQSVVNAFETLDCEARLTNDLREIERARAYVLPGVGTFQEGMDNLLELGLLDVLNEQVLVQKKPFLGICLGMQLLAEKGFEFGVHNGMGWIPGSTVEEMKPSGEGYRIPHMGWNDIRVAAASPIFEGIPEGASFYFVHSFHLVCDNAFVTATCDHGGDFTACVQRENIFGTQFHPEKSREHGLKLLSNFLKIVEQV